MNKLALEQSPYLLQHAHQPVEWYPWGEEALSRAKSEDKPILLSIGYATCHWCHVMAHESFDDPTVAAILNEHFISIKLDREERPDIDHVYMTAVSRMTGSGGWPLNVFLTHDGKPFYGGTYFPPEPRYGMMSFKELLKSIHHAWSQNRLQLLEQADEIISFMKSLSTEVSNSSLTLDEKLLQRAFDHIVNNFDHTHAGFGQMPKFPMGHYLWFLLRFYHQTNNQQALTMVTATLTQMMRGGIYDHVGGGFHRYSVDERWHVPHFEKMLYDQAMLLRAYTEAYQVTGELQFAQTARAIADYVLRDMTHVNGGFYSAEDADSLNENGVLAEGAFYVFDSKSIEGILSEIDGKIFNLAFGVEEHGNVAHDPHQEFIGKNVLYRKLTDEQVAQHLNLEIARVRESLEESLARLYQARLTRPRPLCDDKILTDLNGLMMASLSYAANVFQEPRYLSGATRCADFIWEELRSDNRLMHRWRNGQKAFRGTLDDYAYLAYGLIELYEASFDVKYLENAQILIGEMVELFNDSNGGFFMNPADATDLPVRPKDLGDNAIACGNSIAAIVLAKLYTLTADEKYEHLIKQIFQGFNTTLQRTPTALVGLWCAWMHIHNGGTEIVFHGQLTHTEIAKMRKVLYKDFRPFALARLTVSNGEACVYICRKRVCMTPVTTAEDFLKIINS